MASFPGQVLALGGIAFRDGLRRRAAWGCSFLFLILSALGAVPFSPGVPTEARAYREAGLSTLFLGGLLLALLVAPVLCTPGRAGGARGERLLALPLHAGVLPAGILLGFGGLLLVYHAAGAIILCLVDRAADPGGGAAAYFWRGATCSGSASFLAAAVALCASQRLPSAAAGGAAVLWLCLAFGSELVPLPLRVFLPAPGTLDPAGLAGASPATAMAAGVHLVCLTSAYLLVAQLLSPALPPAE